MKAYHILIFLFSVIFVLAGICVVYPTDGINFMGKNFLFPSIHEALSKREVDHESADEKLRKLEESLLLKIQLQQDSIHRADSIAYADTLNFYKQFFEKHPARIFFPDSTPDILFSLFEDFDNCKNTGSVIHIMHYGDSQIEGDRISGYIRQQLQEKFGGNGPGLIPAIQPIPSAAVGQLCSDSIPRFLIDGTLRQKADHNRYGALGQVAELDGSCTITVLSRNLKTTFSRTKMYDRVKLYVGNNRGKFSATLSAKYIGKITKTIEASEDELSILTWDLDTTISKFTLNIRGKAEIYGIAVDGKSGIAVDNIPMRGSSGTYFSKISKKTLIPMYNDLNVRLIILEFGGNAMPYLNTEKALENYKTSISNQIDYLKRIYPNAEYMFIGPADMSVIVKGKLQTYPNLEKNIAGLKEAANENGAMFWDMYSVMGGKNSMIKWVDNQPALAAPDYIHFTSRGANRIAEVFIETINNYYEYYHFTLRQKEAMEMPKEAPVFSINNPIK